MDVDQIRGWLAVIDDVSYYELLGVEPASGQDQIRRAFHGFAATFHPDGHAVRPPAERAAIHRIFTRGTEAYRVLSDAALRARYDALRAGPGNEKRLSGAMTTHAARPAVPTAAPPAPPPPPPSERSSTSSAPRAPASAVGRLEDHVKNARARPFAQQAEALAKKHEYSKAKLQLKLAMNMDQGNPALQGYLTELDRRIAESKRKQG